MEKAYRLLLLLLALLIFSLIVLDVYYAFIYSKPAALPFVPVTRSGRLTGVLIILILCFILTVSLLVVRKRLEQKNDINRSIIRLYKLVFNGLSTGILVLDRYDRIRYINPVFYSLIGYDEEVNLNLKHYAQVINPILQPIAEKLSQAVESGEEFTREYRVFLPSGIRSLKCGFYSVNDSHLGKLSILTIEDRTREDAIKQKLSRQLEETHRHAVARDNFFANMSHEIRTPINAVLGMAYFAKKLSENEKCTEYIQKIENASELLLGVVNDILDFSRMQENKFTLNPELFNIHDLKKILLDLFTLKAQQKGLEFLVEFNCPDPLPVYGDQFRLTQIFMNLAGNAIKFTDKGLVAVALNYEKIGSDIILRCSVRDTGCGISEEEMGKLFTDFEQFGQVLVKSQEGTGLGLAISKRLVELMKGVIWVDSIPGKGSSFYFVVLLRDPEATGNALVTKVPRVKNIHGQILLLEPNVMSSEIAMTLLQTFGYTGVVARTVDEGLDLCRNAASGYYDAIMIASGLVKTYGNNIVSVFKEEAGEDCPVLTVIPSGLDESGSTGSFDGVLHTPYNPEEFSKLFPEFTL